MLLSPYSQVRADGDALEFASPELQGHRDVVLAAVQGGAAETQAAKKTVILDGGRSGGGGGGDGGEDTGRGIVVVHRVDNGVDDESSVEMAC